MPQPLAARFHAALWCFSKARERYLHETTLARLQVIHLSYNVSLYSPQRKYLRGSYTERLWSLFGAGNLLWFVCAYALFMHMLTLT